MRERAQKQNATTGKKPASEAKSQSQGFATPAQERPGHDFSRITIQPKLTVGAPGDVYEREADEVAERVLQAPAPGILQTKRVEVGSPTEATEATPSVQAALSEPGQRLDRATSGFMESRFGHDFGNVRVLTGPTAHSAARSVGALAFTVGDRIAFRDGAYAPATGSGRRLLAHELTHVLQQRSGDKRVQRRREGEKEAPAQEGVAFWFRVRVDRVLDPDGLLLEFVQQYRHVDEAGARALIESEQWRMTGIPSSVTEEDARRGYKLIHVRDLSLRAATEEERQERVRYFRGLGRQDRAAIEREADRQLEERTQIGAGERLGTSSQRQTTDQYRDLLRDELIQQRQAIEALPEEIREFIFGQGGRQIQPGDYAAVLRIAQKLMEMTSSERQSYLERTTGRTSDLATFEAALDRYRDELRRRQEATAERERTKTALLGLDEVYRLYREWLALRDMSADVDPYGLPIAPSTAELETEETLRVNLRRHGYNSIRDFEAAIRAFKAAFQNETVFIAEEMLDRYEHVLMTQEERYLDSAQPRELHGRLGGARGHFEEAHRIRREHASMPMTPDEMAEQAHWSGQFRQHVAEGTSEVASQGADHPLLRNSDFPVEDLALAGEGDIQGVLLGYIRERQEDVRETRENIRENPALVWRLDTLLQQSMQLQDISPGSIYQRIIEDHVRDEAIDRVMINLAIAVIAVASGLLSGGTGTVAVLGASTALGISAYQAFDEYRRYEMESAAHGAQLLSDDPSFAWVVVAVVGAGIDLAVAASVMRAMRPAVQAFNETGDVAELERQLRRISEVNDALRRNVVSAARAESEAREAWRVARSRSALYSAIDPVVTPLLILAVRFAYPVYRSLRQGLISFERFLLTREAVSLVGDFRRLSPEALAKVRGAYQVALRDAQALAGHGHSLGMLDAEIERFLLMWNRHPNLSADEMMRQMTQWAEPLSRRPDARARVAPDMILDPASRRHLPDFEQQIAGTGGIERIVVNPGTTEGRLAVTIEGEILPSRLARRAGNVSSRRRRAPDFNRSGSLFTSAEAGLGPNWQRLHLWGPGFGDEAAAGMMWGPRQVNLVWQNDSIESYIRQLGELVYRRGGRTRVRATAIAWENPTPSGWTAPQGESFLKAAEYEVTVIRPGEPGATIRIHLEVAEPPGTGIRSFSIDPPEAANLGDLF